MNGIASRVGNRLPECVRLPGKLCIIQYKLYRMENKKNLHEEFPLCDEELRGRHAAETLVGGDEEQSAHPALGPTRQRSMGGGWSIRGKLHKMGSTNNGPICFCIFYF